ncbi:hypothetical protein MANY_06570 [Mycolicibacterium anyangense]|uniref:Uncharacterized protein n=1 Tax=Mycolicibacterium anyangense TaxID=1431246 RepID=A0A6N4W0A0_9MYCO|nr:hypothetical protein MANY_06570 [Mycolicibacterium anyangense]
MPDSAADGLSRPEGPAQRNVVVALGLLVASGQYTVLLADPLLLLLQFGAQRFGLGVHQFGNRG